MSIGKNKAMQKPYKPVCLHQAVKMAVVFGAVSCTEWSPGAVVRCCWLGQSAPSALSPL